MNPRRYQFRTVQLLLVTVVVALTVMAAKEDPIYGTAHSSILLVVLAGVLGAVTGHLVSHDGRYGLVGGLLCGVLGLHLAVIAFSLGLRIADKTLVVGCVCVGGVIGGLIPTTLHRWRQASFRSRMSILLVGLALLVIVTGFTAIRWRTVSKQTRIVAKWQRAGALVDYYDINPFPMIVDSMRMPTQSRYEWLRKLLGLRVVRRVILWKHVGDTTTSVDFGSMDALASMPLVEELALHADHMENDDVVALLNSGQLSNLKCFRITGRRFNDESFSQLDSLPSVELLDLRGTSVSDESVEHIATFPRLKILDVRETDVTKAGLKRLKSKVGRVVSSN